MWRNASDHEGRNTSQCAIWQSSQEPFYNTVKFNHPDDIIKKKCKIFRHFNLENYYYLLFHRFFSDAIEHLIRRVQGDNPLLCFACNLIFLYFQRLEYKRILLTKANFLHNGIKKSFFHERYHKLTADARVFVCYFTG